jgi:hypothetical protein
LTRQQDSYVEDRPAGPTRRGGLRGLVIRLEDRTGDEQAGLARAFVEVGEYGLVPEGLARHRLDVAGHMAIETRISGRC